MSQLPKFQIFVNPLKLKFALDDESKHKQILTIYNPHDLQVKYKIYTTQREKYEVNSPKASINPRHRADIVIRLVQVNREDCNVIDKFRVRMFDESDKVLGEQIVEAVLERSKAVSEWQDSLTVSTSSHVSSLTYPHSHNDFDSREPASPTSSNLILFIAIVCIIGLFIPTESKSNDSIFQISVTLKYTLCYILGMVTMVILRTPPNH